MSENPLRDRLVDLPEQSRRELRAFIESSTPSSLSGKVLQETLNMSVIMHRTLAGTETH